MQLENIIFDETWDHYKLIEPYCVGGVDVPGLSGCFYRKEIGGVEISIGYFSLNGTELFRAWGIRTEPHCSHHAYVKNGIWSDALSGCPVLVLDKGYLVLKEGDEELFRYSIES